MIRRPPRSTRTDTLFPYTTLFRSRTYSSRAFAKVQAMRKLALLVIDMQQGLFSSPPHDADGLVSRINSLAARMRAKRVPVIFMQHCGPEGDDLHPSQPGHALHNDLAVGSSDLIIATASCDDTIDTKSRPKE